MNFVLKRIACLLCLLFVFDVKCITASPQKALNAQEERLNKIVYTGALLLGGLVGFCMIRYGVFGGVNSEIAGHKKAKQELEKPIQYGLDSAIENHERAKERLAARKAAIEFYKAVNPFLRERWDKHKSKVNLI